MGALPVDVMSRTATPGDNSQLLRRQGKNESLSFWASSGSSPNTILDAVLLETDEKHCIW
jgi:hypothetical protein